MNRCKTCRHFEPAKDGRGHCGRIIASYAYEISTVPVGEIVVEVDEGWGAMMHEEFGCVLWEALKVAG